MGGFGVVAGVVPTERPPIPGDVESHDDNGAVIISRRKGFRTDGSVSRSCRAGQSSRERTTEGRLHIGPKVGRNEPPRPIAESGQTIVNATVLTGSSSKRSTVDSSRSEGGGSGLVGREES